MALSCRRDSFRRYLREPLIVAPSSYPYTTVMLKHHRHSPAPSSICQPRGGGRLQPTAQAVGRVNRTTKPRRGERKCTSAPQSFREKSKRAPRPAPSLRQLPSRYLTARCHGVVIFTREKIARELFHTTKNFVLLCRTDSASKNSFCFWQPRLVTQALSAVKLIVPATS